VIVANSVTAPNIIQDQLRSWTGSGQSFSGSVGLLSSATGTNTYPLSIFNASGSGKSILLYSLQITTATGSMTGFLKYVTANPAFGTAITVTNNKPGGTASVIASNCSTTTTSQTLTTPYAQVVTGGTGVLELLQNSAYILLPVGSANGVVLYLQTYGAGNNSITARWIEY
jgi:hypothetical protein